MPDAFYTYKELAMKKGFTMIELIFVIVILGILASVAIPRLAATRTDAHISAAVANLRTLVNDINSYYAVKGEFADGASGVKWNEITNVPIEANHKNTNNLAVGGAGYLLVDGQRCIEVSIHNGTGNFPARIAFSQYPNGRTNSRVCKEVLDSAPIKAYLDSTANGLQGIAIGSSIYPSTVAKPAKPAKP